MRSINQKIGIIALAVSFCGLAVLMLARFFGPSDPGVSTPKVEKEDVVSTGTVVSNRNGEDTISAFLKKKEIDPDFDWKQAIELYGVIRDQNDAPIPHVSVSCQWTDMSLNGSSTTNIISGADGTFEVQGLRGKLLSVLLAKPGFSESQTNQSTFEFGNPSLRDFHRPNRAKPVEFRMFRHGEKRALQYGKIKAPLSHDGEENRVLIKGVNSRTLGPLILRSWTEKRSEAKPKPDWRVEIRLENAEILETTAEFPFEAPQGGYRAEYLWQASSESPDWTADFTKNIFFRTGPPVIYGRLYVSFLTWGKTVVVEHWVNTDGSRILEPTHK